MEKKPKKQPKLFARPMSAADLEKKVMKRIYLRDYKDALGRLLVRDASGSYAVKPGLAAKDARLLKKIAVSVRRNTGFVQKGKLIFAAAAAVIIIAFNVLFKDMLVELAAEAGLQAVFQARADIRHLQFQVLNGRIAFDHLEVADASRPMRNLFELGAVELKIDVAELLKNNVVIDNLMCRDIRWDTQRAFSGALPGASTPSPEAARADDQSFSLLTDAGAVAGGLLEREKDHLQSLKALKRMAADYPKNIAAWEQNIEELGREFETVQAAVKTAAAIDPATIKTPAATTQALATVARAYQGVSDLKRDLDAASAAFRRERALVTAEAVDLDKRIQADRARLATLLGNPLGVGRELVDGLLDRLLTRHLGEAWRLARQALAAAGTLKPDQDRKAAAKTEAPAPEQHYRFIRFPGTGAPKFWLKNASASVGISPAEHLAASLSDVTGEPDMIDKPTAFSFERQTDTTSLRVSGFLDGRRDAPARFSAVVGMTGQPLLLEEGMAALNISRVSGSVGGGLEFLLTRDNRTAGKLALTLRDAVFTKGPSPTRFTDLAHTALSRLPALSVSGSFRTREDGTVAFDLDSNLDEALLPVIKSILNEQLALAQAQVKAEFDKLLKDKLGEHGKLAARYVDMEKLLAGDLSSLADASRLLDEKKKEITRAAAGGNLPGLTNTLKF